MNHNDNKITALRLAREHVPTVDYICIALEDVGRNHLGLEHACLDLRTYIQGQLGECYTLESWLEDNLDDITAYLDRERMLVTRLAWIDWMIEQLEAP